MNYKNKTLGEKDLNSNDFENQTFENCKFVGNIRFVSFLNCIFKKLTLF